MRVALLVLRRPVQLRVHLARPLVHELPLLHRLRRVVRVVRVAAQRGPHGGRAGLLRLGTGGQVVWVLRLDVRDGGVVGRVELCAGGFDGLDWLLLRCVLGKVVWGVALLCY